MSTKKTKKTPKTTHREKVRRQQKEKEREIYVNGLIDGFVMSLSTVAHVAIGYYFGRQGRVPSFDTKTTPVVPQTQDGGRSSAPMPKKAQPR